LTPKFVKYFDLEIECQLSIHHILTTSIFSALLRHPNQLSDGDKYSARKNDVEIIVKRLQIISNRYVFRIFKKQMYFAKRGIF
jgi:hypothetical protein